MTNPRHGIRPASAPKLNVNNNVMVVTADDGSWSAMYVDGTLVRQGESFEPEWLLGFSGMRVGSVVLSEIQDFEEWSHQAPQRLAHLVDSITIVEQRIP